MIMSGQMSTSKETLVEDFIKNNNPYKKNEPLQFDMRAYASYVKENNLTASQITDTILKRFTKG